MTDYWTMNTFLSLIYTFALLLLILIPVMIIAFWPEDYDIYWKTRRNMDTFQRSTCYIENYIPKVC